MCRYRRRRPQGRLNLSPPRQLLRPVYRSLVKSWTLIFPWITERLNPTSFLELGSNEPGYNKPQAIACSCSRTEITRLRTFSSKSWRSLLTRVLRRRPSSPLQSAAQAWCKQKVHVLQASSNARRTTGLIAIPTSSASIWDRQGRRSVFATGGVSMAVTGMPSFRASFAEAAYKRDLLHRPAF